MRLFFTACVAVALAQLACGEISGGFVSVSSDGTHFVDATGCEVVPYGYNTYGPRSCRIGLGYRRFPALNCDCHATGGRSPPWMSRFGPWRAQRRMMTT